MGENRGEGYDGEGLSAGNKERMERGRKKSSADLELDQTRGAALLLAGESAIGCQ